MSEMKPVAWQCKRDCDESWSFCGDKTAADVCAAHGMEVRTLYDTTAFRALVERVCDPANDGRGLTLLALEERTRIRAALLAAL